MFRAKLIAVLGKIINVTLFVNAYFVGCWNLQIATEFGRSDLDFANLSRNSVKLEILPSFSFWEMGNNLIAGNLEF